MAGYFSCLFLDWDGVVVHKHVKKNEAIIQPSWTNKRGREKPSYLGLNEWFQIDYGK